MANVIKSRASVSGRVLGEQVVFHTNVLSVSIGSHDKPKCRPIKPKSTMPVKTLTPKISNPKPVCFCFCCSLKNFLFTLCNR
ncbi:MAG: hypothetical protein FWB72_03210 [Firmicutes bacterium]|nr:hypothetical protein [Bacillota bacterium]